MKLSIPLENIEALAERFEQLTNKADKLGIPAPQLIMGEVYSVERKFSRQDGFILPFPVLDYYQRIEVVGEGIDQPISYGTHKIVGVYNHEYERAMYSSFSPDIRPNPDYTLRFRQKNVSHCEHCNKTIRRNNTYLIASEDGKQMLVGSSCMKAFVPLGKSVESIVAYYKSIWDSYLDDELFERDFSGSSRFESVRSHLMRVLILRKFTIVSHTDKEGFNSLLMSMHGPDFYREYNITNDNITECRALAQEVIDWWKQRNVPEHHEFDYKIQTIVMSETMRSRDANVASWAVHKWYDAVVPKVITGANEFLGEVGGRLNNIEVVLEREQYLYANEYGVTYLYVFKTAEGNTITWKTSPRPLEQGQRLLLSGRVKEHEEFRGVNQTVVTRPTLRDIES